MEGRWAELVGRLASVSGVVVLGGGHEGVGVGRGSSRAGETVVHFDPVPVPRDLSQGVASFGSADQGDSLTQPDCFAFDVAGDFRGSGRVCNKKQNLIKKLLKKR